MVVAPALAGLHAISMQRLQWVRVHPASLHTMRPESSAGSCASASSPGAVLGGSSLKSRRGEVALAPSGERWMAPWPFAPGNADPFR